MAKHINRCSVCGRYTMKDTHCNQKVENSRPPKYSPDDQYARYRREVKKKKLIDEGLI